MADLQALIEYIANFIQHPEMTRAPREERRRPAPVGRTLCSLNVWTIHQILPNALLRLARALRAQRPRANSIRSASRQYPVRRDCPHRNPLPGSV